ncbi:hypothetical protein CPLU01_01198 [Colletotrichum plurivorum]|uniref:Uncharacterized protein n=1 Tax=Colletotrichum plurivorum TaxID=2175906 RepID=A0A8H6NQ34_9PEZI|nr:hypothetical protein CPLU01_01198 [Colletotrichum plurivorum]
MTTITTSIRPTLNLVQWRQKHSSRYPIRLSDYWPSVRTGPAEPSCIRSRKVWMIDHTMYASTREGGTCVFRSPKPKELHEMQWDIGTGQVGKFVREEEVVLSTTLSQRADLSNYEDTFNHDNSQYKLTRAIRSTISLRPLKKAAMMLYRVDGKSPEKRRRSWFANMLGLDTVLSFREPVIPELVPLPDGCASPHAIFARKFSLVADGLPLPSSLSYDLMPTAEIKARRLLVEAATGGQMSAT